MDMLSMLADMINSDSQSEKKTYNTTRLSAMNYLARREHSVRELHQKLKSKQFPGEVIDKVIADLGAEGLQSDSRYTENYIRMRSGKGYGPQRIRIELGERGISSELIDNSLESSGIDWYDHAMAVRQKKFGTEIKTDWKEISKQSRFLQYRGFTSDQIQYAVKED